MKNLTIRNIANACGGELTGNEKDFDTEVCGVVIDSRKIEKGYCFIATPGERVDGHSFIPDVLEKGASCVICREIPAGLSGNFIKVQDSFDALRKVAAFYREQLSIPVIGITGSVGKTSTKEFIAGTLSAKYTVLKTEGNYNNDIGVPQTLLRIRDTDEVAVVEMGINHFGEMRLLSSMVKPDICVMTNIGECHLEFLGDREGVLKAKSEIFEHMSPEGSVFVNGDDDMLRTIEMVKGKAPVRFGQDTTNDYYVTDLVTNGLKGSDAVIHTPKTSFSVHVNLPGKHMVQNALAATAVGEALGLTTDEIRKGIESVRPLGGRSNILSLKAATVIDDCYNANPVSMRAAIDLLSEENKTIAILGDMFELGQNESELHGSIGRYAVEKGIKALVCVGELSKAMYKEACKEKEKRLSNTMVQYYKTPEEVLKQFENPDFLPEGVTILVKASHGMHFDMLVNRLKELGS
ncbi:MAG: UDP-N-acetylmuramoyl-tripeptide--D-alanyl-D-alanine ligase [Lachnospiraceae bacterium]|nr:UDP-N-acetylmuramoyl-tripeptide--D-alanyl-D-alanine ligase [Lachnospiraceae bacterium]